MLKSAIKRAAHKAGIENAHQLSQAAGINRQVVYRIWEDDSRLDFTKLGQLVPVAAALGCSIEDLYICVDSG